MFKSKPLVLSTTFAGLDFQHQQTNDITTEGTNLNDFNIVITAVPILFVELLADPICNVMRKHFNIKTQLIDTDTWHHL